MYWALSARLGHCLALRRAAGAVGSIVRLWPRDANKAFYAKPAGSDVFRDVGSKLRITDMQVFGVTLDERIAQATARTYS